jgi:prolyl oligopeptidase
MSRTVRDAWPSDDGRKVAVLVAKNNADRGDLVTLDVGTGAPIPGETIPDLREPSVAWVGGSRGFFYRGEPQDSRLTGSDRAAHAEIRLHVLDGTQPDQVVRPATGNPELWESPVTSVDGRWLVVTRDVGYERTEVFAKSLTTPEADWIAVVQSMDGVFQVALDGNDLYFLTTYKAPGGRVVRVDLRNPTAWSTVVPERPRVVLEELTVTRTHLAIRSSRDAVHSLEVVRKDGSDLRSISLPGMGSVDGPRGLGSDPRVLYGFSSFTRPKSFFVYDPESGRSVDVPIRDEEGARVEPDRFVVSQQFATSADGVRVPYFYVRLKDARIGPSTPTIVYGYGGHGVSVKPEFVASLLAWVEQGGAYAVANLRGGSEYGEEWHRAAMTIHKQRAFDDYVAVAEDLVKRGWTRAGRLIARGGSHAGLVVGAAITQRPELFGAALCRVPVLDMLRYPLFGIGSAYVSEFGDPANPKEFQALRAYSPVHNVRTGVRYPATLVMSADSDDRVDPMHARKFVAALQRASAGGPVLLRVERQAGHGGSGSVSDVAKEDADAFAFALAEVMKR